MLHPSHSPIQVLVIETLIGHRMFAFEKYKCEGAKEKKRKTKRGEWIKLCSDDLSRRGEPIKLPLCRQSALMIHRAISVKRDDGLAIGIHPNMSYLIAQHNCIYKAASSMLFNAMLASYAITSFKL